MPKFSVDKSSLEGLKNPPAGIYEFRLDGFKPKKSKKGDSFNLRPQLVVVNNAQYNDKPIFSHGNTAFGAELFDLSHAVGVPYVDEQGDDPQLPGEFRCRIHGDACDDSDPDNWDYLGPLVGQVGKVEVADTTDQNGKPTTQVKKFFCRVAGCTMPHRDSLISK